MGPLTRDQAAVLEAALDPRIGMDLARGPAEVVASLQEQDLLGATRREEAAAALTAARRAQEIEWAARTLTHGEVLDAFAAHCADQLDDVTVLERGPDVLVTSWRRETSRIELRAGFLGFERLVAEEPRMLIGVIGEDSGSLVASFLDDPELRTKLAVCDLTRLERVGTPRSSVFVYLEWFLREAYGVKLLPAAAFTQGLIDRGIISLGMG
jgi:hypothetical protein